MSKAPYINMLYAPHPRWLRWGLIACVLALLLFAGLQIPAPRTKPGPLPPSKISFDHESNPTKHTTQPATSTHGSTANNVSLPPEYQRSDPPLVYCDDRFGHKYLHNLIDSSISYCDTVSPSSLTCFHSQTSKEGRIDSFCITGPSQFDQDEKKLKFACRLTEWTAHNNARQAPKLHQLATYWYETGPGAIFKNFVAIYPPEQVDTSTPRPPASFSILVRREKPVTNLWHSLMQIWSLYMSMDILRTALDPVSGKPFLSGTDLENTQVVILDEYQNGPFYDLWTLVAKKPTIRWTTLLQGTTDSGRLIVPLAGGSNPMWQNDWELHSCQNSELLRVFARRVLNFYAIEEDAIAGDAQLVLTFIDRREKRRLMNKERYLEKLRLRFPDVTVQVVDFGSISFAEQLKIAQRTDILVGVHGAGLTHSMFQQPGSAMVEILPLGLNYKGFHSLAKLKGHRYFSSHALQQPTNSSGDWQQDDVYMEEDRFLDLLTIAIKGMYDRRLVDKDVT